MREIADRLVAAVHDWSGSDVDALLDAVTNRAEVEALLVTLAAMVPADMPADSLLTWLDNPAEYRRLRESGVGSFAAMNVIRAMPKEGAA